jgi:DNA polymerase
LAAPPPRALGRSPERAVEPGAPPTGGDRADRLRAIRADLGDCRRCALHRSRKNIVFGVGNPQAEVVLVGEGPGANEDIQGEPFVGDAGALLDRIVGNVLRLARDQVYICNVVKCRPPGNRDPEPDEVAACSPFLWRQIDAIGPRVVIALGRFAAQCLLQTDAPISRLRGRAHPFRGAVLVPTFHPAYLLRNPGDKRKTLEDMMIVRAEYERITGRSLPRPLSRSEAGVS